MCYHANSLGAVCARMCSLGAGAFMGVFWGILGQCEIRRDPQLRSVAHSRILTLVQRRAPALPQRDWSERSQLFNVSSSPA